jgi:hypothetical protein
MHKKEQLMKEKVKTKRVPGKNGGARDGAGRKQFAPTDSERRQVARFSGCGLPQPQIAALVRDGISEDTLFKYFGKELKLGKAQANSKVAQTLFDKAVGGDTTSMIWWTKTQMRWSEVHHLEHTSPDGSMTPKSALDATKLSDSALEEILAAKK